MFPGIDIQGLAVGILRKMERHGGKHGTVDVTKRLVGTCLLSVLYVLLLDTREFTRKNNVRLSSQ
jgi:hypothetical protein